MASLGVREMAAAVRAIGHGRLARYSGTGVSATDRFERDLRAFMGTRHALAVNSGTSALVCALAALRVGPGDEILVPAYTWVSSAAAVVAVGAVPVLVEIDESLTIDPDDIERKISPRTRGIIPVHMLNLVSDMDRIMAIARAHDLVVVEDACQAVGATYKGRRVGSIGDAGAFSFTQHKNIRSGEGGAVLVDDERLFVRASMFHDVGSFSRPMWIEHEEPPFVGLSLRMPELSSAILRPQLARLDKQLARRRARRLLFLEELSGRNDVSISPHRDPGAAVGLTVHFADPEQARRFAGARGVNRLIDTGRHVFTNWQSIRARRTFDPRIDPWSGSAVDYADDAFPRTIQILERTCSVSLDPDVPMPVMRRLARQLGTTALRSPHPCTPDRSPR